MDDLDKCRDDVVGRAFRLADTLDGLGRPGATYFARQVRQHAGDATTRYRAASLSEHPDERVAHLGRAAGAVNLLVHWLDRIGVEQAGVVAESSALLEEARRLGSMLDGRLSSSEGRSSHGSAKERARGSFFARLIGSAVLALILVPLLVCLYVTLFLVLLRLGQ
jgi:hypothetical protein